MPELLLASIIALAIWLVLWPFRYRSVEPYRGYAFDGKASEPEVME